MRLVSNNKATWQANDSANKIDVYGGMIIWMMWETWFLLSRHGHSALTFSSNAAIANCVKPAWSVEFQPIRILSDNCKLLVFDFRHSSYLWVGFSAALNPLEVLHNHKLIILLGGIRGEAEFMVPKFISILIWKYFSSPREKVKTCLVWCTSRQTMRS